MRVLQGGKMRNMAESILTGILNVMTFDGIKIDNITNDKSGNIIFYLNLPKGWDYPRTDYMGGNSPEDTARAFKKTFCKVTAEKGMKYQQESLPSILNFVQNAMMR